MHSLFCFFHIVLNGFEEASRFGEYYPEIFEFTTNRNIMSAKAKFYVEPPWEGGTKVCINGPGHMTKMATMPIYGKNF